MHNELLFLMHTLIVAVGSTATWLLGKEALVAYVTVLFLLANILITKQITLFGFHATATDAYIVGSALGINLLNEFYGRKYARTAIYVTFIISLLFIFLSMLHIAYIPSTDDVYHQHFAALFAPQTRIIIASFISYIISQTVEYKLYVFLKNSSLSHYLVSRNWITLSICQLIDTVLFTIIGLYGVMGSLGSIIMISYSIKLITIICMSPLLILVKTLAKYLPHHE